MNLRSEKRRIRFVAGVLFFFLLGQHYILSSRRFSVITALCHLSPLSCPVFNSQAFVDPSIPFPPFRFLLDPKPLYSFNPTKVDYQNFPLQTTFAQTEIGSTKFYTKLCVSVIHHIYMVFKIVHWCDEYAHKRGVERCLRTVPVNSVLLSAIFRSRSPCLLCPPASQYAPDRCKHYAGTPRSVSLRPRMQPPRRIVILYYVVGHASSGPWGGRRRDIRRLVHHLFPEPSPTTTTGIRIRIE